MKKLDFTASKTNTMYGGPSYKKATTRFLFMRYTSHRFLRGVCVREKKKLNKVTMKFNLTPPLFLDLIHYITTPLHSVITWDRIL